MFQEKGSENSKYPRAKKKKKDDKNEKKTKQL